MIEPRPGVAPTARAVQRSAARRAIVRNLVVLATVAVVVLLAANAASSTIPGSPLPRP